MWLDWNLADPATRAAAVADIRDMVDGVGVTYLRVVAAALDGDTVDHDALAGRVLPPTWVELLVRDGRLTDAARGSRRPCGRCRREATGSWPISSGRRRPAGRARGPPAWRT